MIVESRLMGDDEIGTQLHRLLDHLTGRQKGDDDASDVLCGIAQLDRINSVPKRGAWYRSDNRVNGILNSQGHERYSPFPSMVHVVSQDVHHDSISYHPHGCSILWWA